MEFVINKNRKVSTYAELPFKFEAGTPDIAGIIGLGAAVDFINSIGIDAIHVYEDELVEYTIERLSEFEEVEIYAKEAKHSGAVSFNLKLDGVHASDVGMILDKKGIAVRTGHHCAQPIMHHFGIPGTVRTSFGIYNTKEEIDTFIEGLKTAIRMLG